MEELRAQLAANLESLSECRTTQIFTDGADASDIHREATEALEAAAQSRAKEEGLRRDSEAEALREEVASLRSALAAEQQRTQTVADCQARQQEIHNTLLQAGYDAAVEAQNEARAEAAALRRQLEAKEREDAAERARHGVRLETVQAEAALRRQERQSQVGALQRELDEARHAANLHRRLLSAELRACERPASEGALPPPAVSPPPRRPAVPSPSQVLRDLGQWAGGGAAAAEPSGADCGSPARGASPRHLQRLQRLEAAADAASARFEALQHEHHKLRRQHQRLKQRLQREEDGARGAGVAGSGERPRRT